MDGGSRWGRHAEGWRWPHMRPAARYVAAGIFLTLLTVVLSSFNAISVQQSIALGLPAAVTTLGAWIDMIVPDAWVAWRRGFQQGCKVAMECQSTLQAATAAPHPIPPDSGEPTVTDLSARRGAPSGHRSQSFR